MNSGKIGAGGWTDGRTDEGSIRAPRGPKNSYQAVFTDSIHTKIKDKTITAVINYESRKHHAVSALSYISNSSAGTVVLSYSSVAKPAVFPLMMRAVRKTGPK